MFVFFLNPVMHNLLIICQRLSVQKLHVTWFRLITWSRRRVKQHYMISCTTPPVYCGHVISLFLEMSRGFMNGKIKMLWVKLKCYEWNVKFLHFMQLFPLWHSINKYHTFYGTHCIRREPQIADQCTLARITILCIYSCYTQYYLRY